MVTFERLFRKKTSTRNSLPETNSSHLRMDGWKTTFFSEGFLSGLAVKIVKHAYLPSDPLSCPVPFRP